MEIMVKNFICRFLLNLKFLYLWVNSPGRNVNQKLAIFQLILWLKMNVCIS